MQPGRAHVAGALGAGGALLAAEGAFRHQARIAGLKTGEGGHIVQPAIGGTTATPQLAIITAEAAGAMHGPIERTVLRLVVRTARLSLPRHRPRVHGS